MTDWKRQEIGVGVERCPQDFDNLTTQIDAKRGTINSHWNRAMAEAQDDLDSSSRATNAAAIKSAIANTQYAGTGATVINITCVPRSRWWYLKQAFRP